MSTRNPQHEQIHELAPLYVAGALDGAEKERFEGHLRRGCAACQSELAALTEVAGALGEAQASEPPSALRESVLARAARTPRRPGMVMDERGVVIASSDEVPWRPVAPGIEYKPLYVDAARKYNTAIVRMQPGTHYPRHRHRDVEQLFLLSGDLRVAGQVMRAGDYCRADLDTIHDDSFTDTGCMFLVIASQQDEMLA